MIVVVLSDLILCIAGKILWSSQAVEGKTIISQVFSITGNLDEK